MSQLTIDAEPATGEATDLRAELVRQYGVRAVRNLELQAIAAEKAKGRKRPRVETWEFIDKFLVTQIRRAGERVAEDGDEPELLRLRQVIEENGQRALTVAVQGMRNRPEPVSWSRIGKGLGISRQAAQQRWGQREMVTA